MDVQSVQYDRQVEAGSSNFGTLPWFLLGNDGGTLGDFLDDYWVYTQTMDSFQFGMVPWATFTISIDSQTQFIQAGWEGNVLPNSTNQGLTQDDIWNLVIQDVSYIGITTGRPWNGGAWFGAHQISYDNFILTASGLSTNYCTPANPNSTGSPGSITADGSDGEITQLID